MSALPHITILLLSLGLVPSALGLDANTNQQSDIWETFYSAFNLPANGDADADGFTNAVESLAGTNPQDAASHPALTCLMNGGHLNLSWPSEAGKLYAIYRSLDLSNGSFLLQDTAVGDGSSLLRGYPLAGSRGFFRIQASDVDTDGDGLTDWDEGKLGFNTTLNHTDRNDTADLARVQSGLNIGGSITVGLVDGEMREDWPDAGLVVIRRSGGLKPLTINLAFTGTATRNVDYTTDLPATQISLPLGAREAVVVLHPFNDSLTEGVETITLTALAGSGYTLGSALSATVNLADAAPQPGLKAAARFLLQAAYGPDQDTTGNNIPENVESLMATTFDAWMEDQFTRPLGYLQPYTAWAVANANAIALYGNYKEHAWWSRAMGAPKLRPDNTSTQLADPLRQRMAFALSEILVVSDRPETLGVDQVGMANYYDLMVKYAFGNYRELLLEVALHPVMGVYLSHLGNQKANLALNLHPDENFAREVMQLFSIGLWQLNRNGTRQVDAQGHFIPTYNNGDITELARVFTGFTFPDSTSFNPNNQANGDKTHAMKCWDAYHDLAPKILLNGLTTPARVASATNTGTAGLADVTAAIENLFNHPNVGPFLSLRLIQRFVTSNPSPSYIDRVAAKFNDNGSGQRGDLRAVIKAILLDPEARDPAMLDLPTWGKLREPLLRVVNLARAFNAASTDGYYPLDQFVLDHLQDPMNAPSVFNFFLPNYSPPGKITDLGLAAPEFQILNASSAITAANYFYSAIGNNDLARWGTGTASYAARLNLNPELAMIVPVAQISANTPTPLVNLDTDALIRRLDLSLMGGTMSPQLFQIIRESIPRLASPSWQWHRERLRLAITLIVTSAEFNVLR